ncbi:MAG: hypothetical protein IH951_03695 [Bacteroidetes bacterium]|nr:hypothetical protein [Bacteroidota bacterium]
MISLRSILSALVLSSLATGACLAQDVKDMNVGELIRALEHENPIIRSRATCSLGEMGQRARPSLNALLELLSDDTVVAYNVCEGIGRRNDWNSYRSVPKETVVQIARPVSSRPVL